MAKIYYQKGDNFYNDIVFRFIPDGTFLNVGSNPDTGVFIKNPGF